MPDLIFPQFLNYPSFETIKKYRDNVDFESHISDRNILYHRFPFCKQKCTYCTFSSLVSDVRIYDGIIDNLKKEINLHIKHLSTRTFSAAFLGGGTPTNLSSEQLADLYGLLLGGLKFMTGKEITIEARPGTIVEDKMKLLKTLGVNRVNLGIQSLNSKELRYCGRLDTLEFIKGDICFLKDMRMKVNLDLIIGLPGQTRASFVETCKQVFMELKPSQVSVSVLMLHPHTPVHLLFQKNRNLFVTEEMRKLMFDDYVSIAEANGYEFLSAWNATKAGDGLSVYLKGNWIGYDRYAIGPDAVGFINEVQYINKSWNDGYQDDVNLNKMPIKYSKQNTFEEKIRRYIILSLQVCYLNIKYIRDTYGIDISEKFKSEITDLISEGYLILKDQMILVTPLGKKYLYYVQSKFFDDYVDKKQYGRAGCSSKVRH